MRMAVSLGQGWGVKVMNSILDWSANLAATGYYSCLYTSDHRQPKNRCRKLCVND